MKKLNFLLLLIVIFSTGLVFPNVVAVTVPGNDATLDVYGCYIVVEGVSAVVNNKAGCNDEVEFFCQVTDYTPAETGPNNVEFVFRGSSGLPSRVSATCYDGLSECSSTDKNNGTWYYRTTGKQIALGATGENATATWAQILVDSPLEGFSCSVGESNVVNNQCIDDDGLSICCNANYGGLGSLNSVISTCETVCRYTEERIVSSSGAITITRTPNEYCEDQDPIYQFVGINSCEPTIVRENTPCIFNNNPSTQDTALDPFSGMREISYYVEPLSCCNSFPELCAPPADEGDMVECTLDFWAGYGQDQYNGQHNFDANSFVSDFYITDFDVADPVAKLNDESPRISGRSIKPVVGDFITVKDGIEEIAYFLESGQVRLSDVDAYTFSNHAVDFSLVPFSPSTVKWLSQPTLFGFNHKFIEQNNREVGWWLGNAQGGLCSGSEPACKACESSTGVQDCCNAVFNSGTTLTEEEQYACESESVIFAVNGEIIPATGVMKEQSFSVLNNGLILSAESIYVTPTVGSATFSLSTNYGAGSGDVFDTLNEGETKTYTIEGVDYEVTAVYITGPQDPSCSSEFACTYSSVSTAESQVGIAALIEADGIPYFVKLLNGKQVVAYLNLGLEGVTSVSSGVSCFEDTCYFTAYDTLSTIYYERLWRVDMDNITARLFNDYGYSKMVGAVSNSCYGDYPLSCNSYTSGGSAACGEQPGCTWYSESSLYCVPSDPDPSIGAQLECNWVNLWAGKEFGELAAKICNEGSFWAGVGADACETANASTISACVGYSACDAKSQALCTAANCSIGTGNFTANTIPTDSQVRLPTPIQTNTGTRSASKVVFPGYYGRSSDSFLSLCDADGGGCLFNSVSAKYGTPQIYSITNVVSDTILTTFGPQMYFMTYDLPVFLTDFNATGYLEGTYPPTSWVGMHLPLDVYANYHGAFNLDSNCIVYRYEDNGTALTYPNNNIDDIYEACPGALENDPFSGQIVVTENDPDGILYIAVNHGDTDRSRLKTFNLSNPAAENVIEPDASTTGWVPTSRPRELILSDDETLLYMLTRYYLVVFDISDKENPKYLSAIEINIEGDFFEDEELFPPRANDFYIIDDIAFIAWGKGLKMVDIADPSAMRLYTVQQDQEVFLSNIVVTNQQVSEDYVVYASSTSSNQIYVYDIYLSASGTDANRAAIAGIINTYSSQGLDLQLEYPYLFIQTSGPNTVIYAIVGTSSTRLEPRVSTAIPFSTYCTGGTGCPTDIYNGRIYMADGHYFTYGGNMHAIIYEGAYGAGSGSSAAYLHKAGLSTSTYDFDQSQFISKGVTPRSLLSSVLDPALAKCQADKLGVMVGLVLKEGKTQFKCYNNNGNQLTEVYSIVTNDRDIKSFATADFDADGIDEIITPSGIYDSSGRQLMATNLQTPGFETAVVDWNADLYADLMFTTGGRTVNYISNPGVGVRFDPDAYPELNECVATAYVNENNNTRVKVEPKNYTLRYPALTRYYGSFQDGTGTSTNRLGTPQLTLIPSQWGTKTVVLTAETALSKAEGDVVNLTVTCPVTIPEFEGGDNGTCTTGNCTPVPPKPTPPVIEQCTFEGINSLGETGWLGISQLASFTDTSMILEGRTESTIITHQLNSGSTIFYYNIRFKPSVGADVSFFINYLSDYSGYDVVLAELKIQNGVAYFLNSDGEYDAFSQGVTAGSWYEAEFVVDLANKGYNVNLGGISATGDQGSVISFKDKDVTAISGVGIGVEGGRVEIDSACVDGTDEYIQDYLLSEIRRVAAFQTLDACSDSTNSGWDRDFDQYPAGTIANYALVQEYCNILGRTYCSVADLQKAIAYNSDCYYEAHNYCQAVTFLKSGRFTEDQTVNSNPKVREFKGNPNLSGELACTTVLGVGAAYSGIITPYLTNLWSLITDNFITVLVAVLIIMMIGMTVALRRKR